MYVTDDNLYKDIMTISFISINLLTQSPLLRSLRKSGLEYVPDFFIIKQFLHLRYRVFSSCFKKLNFNISYTQIKIYCC